MTEQEAIEYLRIQKPTGNQWYKEPTKKAFNMAIKALEKQIPKEPSQLLKHKDSFDWECPKCHMTYGCCNVKVNYCYECGQAIKWQ